MKNKEKLREDLENLIKLKGVTLQRFKKGELIFRQGEKVQWIFYLKKGSCYHSVVSKQGEEFCYWIQKTDSEADDLLGVFSLYGHGYSGSTITAKTECVCYKIPGNLFLKYADERPALLRGLLERCLRQYGDLDKIFHAYREKSASEQVAEVLIKEFQGKDGKPIQCTLDSLSQKTALHRVTVAKIMGYLKKEGIIQRKGNELMLISQLELEEIALGKKIKYYKNRR